MISFSVSFILLCGMNVSAISGNWMQEIALGLNSSFLLGGNLSSSSRIACISGNLDLLFSTFSNSRNSSSVNFSKNFSSSLMVIDGTL